MRWREVGKWQNGHNTFLITPCPSLEHGGGRLRSAARSSSPASLVPKAVLRSILRRRRVRNSLLVAKARPAATSSTGCHARGDTVVDDVDDDHGRQEVGLSARRISYPAIVMYIEHTRGSISKSDRNVASMQAGTVCKHSTQVLHRVIQRPRPFRPLTPCYVLLKPPSSLQERANATPCRDVRKPARHRVDRSLLMQHPSSYPHPPRHPSSSHP